MSRARSQVDDGNSRLSLGVSEMVSRVLIDFFRSPVQQLGFPASAQNISAWICGSGSSRSSSLRRWEPYAACDCSSVIPI